MRKFEVLTPEALLERSGTGQEGKQTEKAQVIEEELEVGVARTTGGKRLKTEVSEREVEETVSLKQETRRRRAQPGRAHPEAGGGRQGVRRAHGRGDRDHGKAGGVQAGPCG